MRNRLQTFIERLKTLLDFQLAITCCYGEHKLQKAWLFFSRWFSSQNPLSVRHFKLDKRCAAPSTINLTDLNRLAFLIKRFMRGLLINKFFIDENMEQLYMPFFAAIVKHNNMCGAGFSLDSPEDALRKAIESNPRDAFGGAMLVNFPITPEHVRIIKEHGGKRNMDVIAAPAYDKAARNELASRKAGKCRVFTNPALASRVSLCQPDRFPHIFLLQGDLLIQEAYPDPPPIHGYEFPAGQVPVLPYWLDFVFAQALMASMNSNTVVLVKDGQLLGAGVGQTSRISAAKIAIGNALEFSHDVSGSTLGSDSFFVAGDVAELAADHFIKNILTTNGSQFGDKPTLAICKTHGIKLVWIDDKVGRFFGWHC